MVDFIDLPEEIKKILRNVGWIDALFNALDGKSVNFANGVMPYDFYIDENDQLVFEFIGNEVPSYSKAETDALLAKKVSNVEINSDNDLVLDYGD